MEVHRLRARTEFFAVVNGSVGTPRWWLERHLAQLHQNERTFTVSGLCSACDEAVAFLVDFDGAWEASDGLLVPNWRESLRCPRCKLNGRQRRVAELVAAVMPARGDDAPPVVYMMEALSPLFRWVGTRFPWVTLLGSEYFDAGTPPDRSMRDVRHEDAERLSFADASIDLVVSCDVFEHVNDPVCAFAEVARVLRPGGRAILTFPMDPHLDVNRRRAALVDGGVRHELPAVYHGNPLSPEGALVFTDFGWEVLAQLRTAGFHDPTLELYWGYERGYLGIQFCFLADKR